VDRVVVALDIVKEFMADSAAFRWNWRRVEGVFGSGGDWSVE